MTTMRNGIICGGTILIDVNKIIDRYPPQDHLALIEAETRDSGGPGFNMAVDLARLGAPFPLELVGVIGADAHGELVLSICRGEGIGTAAIAVLPDVATSYTDVMIVKDGGRRTFFHHKGANALLSPDRFDFARTPAKILHLGAPGLHDTLDRPAGGGNGFADVLARARAAGLRTNMELVSLAPERIRELARPCLPHLDYIIVNEIEAAALTGIDLAADGPADWTRAEAAAAALLALGVSELAVIHFPAGCVAAGNGGRTWRQGSVRVPPADVKSTNGAGDAFASGVLLGLHEGWPVERCLRLGVCVAAVSLGSYSPSAAIRPARECLAYGERLGFRPA
jgi:sugar/nucleoside kinase (ribokinase family)